MRWNLEPLGKEIRDELARFGPQAGMPELLDRWPDAVGEGIARNAWPARIAKDGTVHVNTADSIWAFELGQRAAAFASSIDDENLRESVQKAVSLALARGRRDRPV